MNNQYIIDNFDEDDDIILPNSIFGEIYYIYCIIKDIYSSKENRTKKWALLKRQIHFFILYMKNK